MAQQIQAHLQSSLEEHVTAVIALNVVYQNFVDISHYDFQRYGMSITSKVNGFRRLMYIDPHLVIRQVYPQNAHNAALLQQSIASDPKLVQLFSNAQSLREPTTSDLLPFRGDNNSLLAIIPIYRSDQEFLGFAVGEIAMRDIWEPISHTEFLGRYQAQLVDPAGHGLFPPSVFQPGEPDGHPGAVLGDGTALENSAAALRFDH